MSLMRFFLMIYNCLITTYDVLKYGYFAYMFTTTTGLITTYDVLKLKENDNMVLVDWFNNNI